MKLLQFLLLSLFIFQSCSKEEVNIKEKMAMFESREEFLNEYENLAKMTTENEVKQWILKRNYESLINEKDAENFQHSDALKAILNKKGEFQIGTSKIKLVENTFFSKPMAADDKEYLEYAKIKVSDAINTRTSFVEVGGVLATYQKEFMQVSHQDCGGPMVIASGKKKFVSELKDETISFVGGLIKCTLFLRVKLEWKGSKGWKVAGEERKIDIGVAGFAQFSIGDLGANYDTNYLHFECADGHDKAIFIRSWIGVPPISGIGWNVSMSGNITQQVQGDPFVWSINPIW